MDKDARCNVIDGYLEVYVPCKRCEDGTYKHPADGLSMRCNCQNMWKRGHNREIVSFEEFRKMLEIDYENSD